MFDWKARTNPFESPEVAAGYEAWYVTSGRRADRLEKKLLAYLLARFPDARTLLEVGCGSGHFTRWFEEEQGLWTVGLDTAWSMLREARSLQTPRLIRADARDLPFPDRSFDLTVMITALEFIHDPATALIEAGRVARQGLLLGVLNRVSLLAAMRWLQGRLRSTPYSQAVMFSPEELELLVRDELGDRVEAIHWHTTLFPRLFGSMHLPVSWGGFIGMAVHLRP